ncbi:sodium/solute symporter [Pseudonocardia hydrocarbonoxydans]|uniref:Cation acetate symporter n=1 Tax=Pseudonocardia hydrocarbonoxydans TaxID=76726 RepID=A0A4Y3WHV4_9PSEU|nr:cation acetate symporter [Pseudonocardia hydrocarbonoxydans]GEC18315.1 cation acetate symporter [Pseudonocardia hydrocarbonoxydans]
MIVAGIVLVVLATLLIGARGVAAMRSTSDFLVASRRISPALNAAAVSGEYLSAASFLGVAGLVVKDGIGALWYPVGFTAGYLAMLALVAAPMRRTGALTVPDFAEARLGSAGLRRLSAVVVLVIATLYLVPQFKAAGQVLAVVAGTPYWVGVVVAGAAVSITLALGGMRAATYVQAFQFGLKLLLFVVPAIWLVLSVSGETRAAALSPVEFTTFERSTPVDFRLGTELTLTEPTSVAVDDRAPEVLEPGRYVVEGGSRWVFAPGSDVPDVEGAVPPGGEGWSRPLLDPGGAGYPVLATLSILVATVLGTMGLPHILVRFHTSPDGRGARRTAAITVALLSAFYLFPAVYGVLGAVLLPELYLSGGTDTVVVSLPARVDGGITGTLFTALLTAGAFAAFLATSLGLLLALSGAVSHDLLPGTTLRRLRLTSLGAAALVVALALPAVHLDVGVLVTSAFAVAASTFCPLLVLGIWWAGLTARGAAVGMIVGLLASAGVIGVDLTLGSPDGLASILLGQPALWSVPLAFATMVLVSLRGRPPAWAAAAMLRLHLDETHRTT